MSTTQERPQTASEELANALSHGLGLLLAIASLPILVSVASRHGGAASVVGACVFSATMILLYATSVLFHALPPGRAKELCNTLDHVAIYLFIAGSYTPFALGVLRGGWGWTLLGLVWAIAAIGVVGIFGDDIACACVIRRIKHRIVYIDIGTHGAGAASGRPGR